MDETFHSSADESREQIQALMRRKNDVGVLRFAIQFGLMVTGGVVMILTYGETWWLWSLAMVVTALGVTPMFAVAHETVHRTAFKSRRLNEVVRVIASFTTLYVPEWFRHFHFAHHRHTHDPEHDPELAPLGFTAPSFTGSLAIYFTFVTGMALVIFKLTMVLLLALPLPARFFDTYLAYVKPTAVRQMRWEARLCLVLHASWIVAGFIWWPGVASLLIAQLVGHGLLGCFLATEHSGLPHEGSVLDRTRTTKTNGLVRYLMWNMPYHAEHHAYPSVPWHALPDLHLLMRDELVHIVPGYPSMHKRILGQLLRGRPFTDPPAR